MGGNQSKEVIASEKIVIERLRAMELKDQADSEYITVGEKDVARPAHNSSFRAPWTSLNISDVEDWESELMQDPKNRQVPHSTI
jgi:bleomycin hydrolase